MSSTGFFLKLTCAEIRWGSYTYRSLLVLCRQCVSEKVIWESVYINMIKIEPVYRGGRPHSLNTDSTRRHLYQGAVGETFDLLDSFVRTSMQELCLSTRCDERTLICDCLEGLSEDVFPSRISKGRNGTLNQYQFNHYKRHIWMTSQFKKKKEKRRCVLILALFTDGRSCWGPDRGR